MTQRITDKDLLGMCNRLNRLTGMPATPYAKTEDGTYKPQAGCYHLDYAYGGVSLSRMSLTEGCTGVSKPLNHGYCTKRELYNQIYAFIRGIESIKIEQE